jgi:signal transduction histidine kinase
VSQIPPLSDVKRTDRTGARVIKSTHTNDSELHRTKSLSILELRWPRLLPHSEISRPFAIRLEERLSERTRIVRELHDALLHGFEGLMFLLQAVRECCGRG